MPHTRRYLISEFLYSFVFLFAAFSGILFVCSCSIAQREIVFSAVRRILKASNQYLVLFPSLFAILFMLSFQNTILCVPAYCCFCALFGILTGTVLFSALSPDSGSALRPDTFLFLLLLLPTLIDVFSGFSLTRSRRGGRNRITSELLFLYIIGLFSILFEVLLQTKL